MIFDIFAAVCIVTCSSILGMRMAKRYSLRVKEIRLFQGAFSQLETEIMYYQSFLPDALDRIARNNHGGVAHFFYAVNTKLVCSRNTVSGAWEKALNETKQLLNVDSEELDMICQFGKYIGVGDKEGHRRCFDMIQAQLRTQEIKADEARIKYEKMYGSLGVLGGLALAILIF